MTNHHHQHHQHVNKNSHQEYADTSPTTTYGRSVVVDPGGGSGGGSGSGNAGESGGQHYGSGYAGRASTSSTNNSGSRSSSTGTGMGTTAGGDMTNLVELAHIATSSPIYATPTPAAPNSNNATAATTAFSTVSQTYLVFILMERKNG
jgi:hypothetical protein